MGWSQTSKRQDGNKHLLTETVEVSKDPEGITQKDIFEGMNLILHHNQSLEQAVGTEPPPWFYQHERQEERDFTADSSEELPRSVRAIVILIQKTIFQRIIKKVHQEDGYREDGDTFYSTSCDKEE
ncbi:hypothetical protein AAES_75687 [Amazona aestiva]|uniref:Uncharacterized protein n=1 Tax=Amazona aestiva TaxID=12930 RepID=A0A0Q3MHM6_AMAAE|nr:hypothetical protein AAES_75687 [Amazona aestiva]